VLEEEREKKELAGDFDASLDRSEGEGEVDAADTDTAPVVVSDEVVTEEGVCMLEPVIAFDAADALAELDCVDV
jgi:hypothetical protein